MSAAEAAEKLLTMSPFELKSMLFSLLSGRLLEEYVDDDAARETRTGIGSFKRHIEERKVLGAIGEIETKTCSESSKVDETQERGPGAGEL